MGKAGEFVKKQTGWKAVWTDAGSGNPKDYAIWVPTCDDGDYLALGVFCVFGTAGYKQPPAGYPVALVHKDLCEPVALDYKLWCDGGSGATQDVTLGNVPWVNTLWPIATNLSLMICSKPQALDIAKWFHSEITFKGQGMSIFWPCMAIVGGMEGRTARSHWGIILKTDNIKINGQNLPPEQHILLHHCRGSHHVAVGSVHELSFELLQGIWSGDVYKATGNNNLYVDAIMDDPRLCKYFSIWRYQLSVTEPLQCALPDHELFKLIGELSDAHGSCVVNTMKFAISAANLTDSDKNDLKPFTEALGGRLASVGPEVKAMAAAHVSGWNIHQSLQWRGQAYKEQTPPPSGVPPAFCIKRQHDA